MKRHLQEIAAAVASAVGDIPLPDRSETVADGADGTPTSHIDRVAEDVILNYVRERDLSLNVLSEEAGFLDSGFRDTLVVDPVDGTFNACSGIPFYSVSLAVGNGSLSGIREGLVMNLVTGDMFHGARGQGATLNGRRISAGKPGNDMLLMAYMGSRATPKTYRVANRFRRVRCLGAVSLEICAVACGLADAFFIDYGNSEKSPRIVDIAAAVPILREAGGQAYDGNQEILDMPLSLKERSDIVAVRSEEILEAMK